MELQQGTPEVIHGVSVTNVTYLRIVKLTSGVLCLCEIKRKEAK
jgi:hypothetical protein